MKHSLPLMGLLCGAMVAGLAYGEPNEPDMQEGLWEISSAVEVPGMPMAMPPTTIQHCFTKSDVADKQKILPINDGKCELQDYKQDGNKATWKMQCRGEMAMKGTGEITYHGDSYQGKMIMEMGGAGQGGQVIQKYSAKRIGDCQ